MKHRKLFVCLTALLLVSVFAVSVSAALNDKGQYWLSHLIRSEPVPANLQTIETLR